jgi:murein DD-endopeptidase MepM/ murein hydrolase activator NlpD
MLKTQIKRGRIFKRIILMLILFCFILAPLNTEASSDKQRQLDELNRRIKENQKIVQQKEQEVQSLANAIAILDGQIQEAELALEATKVQISETNDEIAAKEEELRQQNKILNESLRLMYEEKETSLLETLLSSKSFSAVLDRLEYLNVVKTKIDSAIKDIQRIKSELESKRMSLEELKKIQVSQANLLNSQKAEKNQLLADTRGEEALYQQKIAADKQKYTVIKSAMESEESGPGGGYGCTYPGSFRGFFYWPMDPQDLHRSVGHVGCDGGYSGHSGIDFSGDYGTPVLASAEGDVAFVGGDNQSHAIFPDSYNTCGTPNYGNFVDIKHETPHGIFYTRYAHLRQGGLIAADTHVYKGDVIGRQGYTGNSCPAGLGGTHLHFEIRLSRSFGSWVNPLPFLP